MMTRMQTAFATVALIVMACASPRAHADNQMGYRLLSPRDAAVLPHNHGTLGLNVERAQQITDGGMTFDIIRVTQVRRGSAGAYAGFKTGDEIVAIDGQVFSSLATFAAYVGSTPPGSQISVDYIPAGGGPQQAQRVTATVGPTVSGGQIPPSPGQGDASSRTGMSTGAKVAIGAGAVALLGCYEMGCFSHRSSATTPNVGRPQLQQQPTGPER